jgi:hypothetical protein
MHRLFGFIALTGVLLAPVARAATAQIDAEALVRLLVSKGLITPEELEALARESAAAVPAATTATPAPTATSPATFSVDAKKWTATSGSKFLESLKLSGRFQAQYANLGTDIDGPATDPADTRHFFLRRIYLTTRADLAGAWSGHLTYDFAGSTFDAAFLQWKQSKQLVLDLGLRKVPFGLEEWGTSSGNLRAIERSPATRYFAEGNNGRRLGAASYRIGAFVSGATESGFSYQFALTNPERDESAAGAAGTGSAANHTVAAWANVGYGGKFSGGDYRLSASLGHLPDQGGKTLGVGDDLTVYNLFAELNRGPLNLQFEYFTSANDHGASATLDASSSAWSVQPAWRVGDFEVVLRYSHVDSDGRGVNLSDGIRSAPSGGTMDTMSEWFLGGNWYLHGNDVKLQAGLVRGTADDTVTGGAARATTTGMRSQLQLQF